MIRICFFQDGPFIVRDGEKWRVDFACNCNKVRLGLLGGRDVEAWFEWLLSLGGVKTQHLFYDYCVEFPLARVQMSRVLDDGEQMVLF